MSELRPHEYCYLDLTSPLSTMIFPLIETLVWTGLCWIAVGYFDRLPNEVGYVPASDLPHSLRSLLVLVWLVVLVWRFILPLARARMWRLMVTNQRIMSRPAALSGKVESLELGYVYRVRRKRKQLLVEVAGRGLPLVFYDVPKTKKVADVINRQLFDRSQISHPL